jgi:expansin
MKLRRPLFPVLVGLVVGALACSGSTAPAIGSGSSGAITSSSGDRSSGSSGLPEPSDGGADAVTSSSGGAAIPQPSLTKGRTTYYNATGEGACGFAASPSDLDVVALNIKQWGSAAYCGACVEVTGPKGIVKVRVTDQCPSCAEGGLDLSASAFAKIADPKAGFFEATWKIVRCESKGPLVYHTQMGSSKFYTALQVRNHAAPIAKLEIEKGGAFVPVERKDYNYFVMNPGVGVDGAFKVRVTATTGQVLTDMLPSAAGSVDTQGASNF